MRGILNLELAQLAQIIRKDISKLQVMSGRETLLAGSPREDFNPLRDL